MDWHAATAVKDVVGRDVNQRDFDLRTGSRDIAGTFGIDTKCSLLVRFRAIDRGVGSAVDYHAHPFNGAADGVRIAHVAFAVPHGPDAKATPACFGTECAPDLAPRNQDQ